MISIIYTRIENRLNVHCVGKNPVHRTKETTMLDAKKLWKKMSSHIRSDELHIKIYFEKMKLSTSSNANGIQGQLSKHTIFHRMNPKGIKQNTKDNSIKIQHIHYCIYPRNLD